MQPIMPKHQRSHANRRQYVALWNPRTRSGYILDVYPHELASLKHPGMMMEGPFTSAAKATAVLKAVLQSQK